jgi:hypothetical protein
MKSYESIECRTKEEAELALQQNSNISRDELVTLLLSLYEIEDVKWVQEQYQKYISNEDYWVASAAITGLGHLARISKSVEKDSMIHMLKDLCVERPELESKIEDAISDIDVFSQ